MYSINKERLIRRFLDLVKIPSPSWKEEAVIDYLIKELDRLKVGYEKYKCGESWNLLARMDGTKRGRPVLFSCHTDTVVPCENVNPVVTPSRISSDGTTILGSDDKAGVACFLEAVECLRESGAPHGPIEFLFSCAEELGLYGIKGFDLSMLRARHGFVFDTGGDIGRIILRAPYHISLDIDIRGRAAHAGMEPEKGVSAIRVLAEILGRIPHGRIDRETTANAGTIAGGKATNIVAEHASCKMEARSLDRKKLASLEAKIRKIIKETAARHGAKATVRRNLEYTGFSIRKDEEIVGIVKQALARVKIRPVFEVSGGGSDTNVINRHGIKAINLSIGMRNVHTKKEYILVKDLVNGARFILALVDSM